MMILFVKLGIQLCPSLFKERQGNTRVDPISDYLVSIGIHVASSAIYDGIMRVLSKPNLTYNELRAAIISSLNVENANVYAEKIIDILAKSGNITISGTHIFANNSINMFSSRNTELSFGEGSVSETKNTKIETTKGARIVSKGGAGIRQNDDGSISFYA